MITVRKIFTEKMNDFYNETGILSDEALIAYLDTHRALNKILENRIFGPFFMFIYVNGHECHGLNDREKRLNLQIEKPELVISEIPSDELLNRVMTNTEDFNITHNEVLTLISYCNNILQLTDFNKKYFFLLRFFVGSLLIDSYYWLNQFEGIAQT